MSVCAAGCSVFVEVGELTQCDASRVSRVFINATAT